MSDPVGQLLASVRRPDAPVVWLIRGDLVIAEPAAARLAAALAQVHGGQVESYRHPPSLAALLQDLRTFSLFGSGKVILAVDTAVFADRAAAADLIDDAEDVLPLRGGAGGGGASAGSAAGAPAGAGAARRSGAKGRGGKGAGVAGGAGEGDGEGDSGDGGGRVGGDRLSTAERVAASRLMQALRLFDIEASGGRAAAEVLDQLPAWVFEGGSAARRGRGGRARGKRQVEELREGLAALLDLAREAGVQSGVEGDASDLAAILAGGLPPGHAIVFAERQVAVDHPLVRLLAERGAVAAVGEVEAGRGGAWQGVEALAAELADETGVTITGDALAELARRTLRKPGDARRGGDAAAAGGATGDSTARLAAEYRKLANLASGSGGGGRGGEGGGGERGAGGGGGAAGGRGVRIDRRLVEEAVEDRGEEDVWKLLDAVGAGRGGEALDRLRRLLAVADDPMAARLSFFALFATFCRRLTAVRGMMKVTGVAAGEANYNRFAARLAPALQGDLPGGKNPLAGVNPFALHRVYLAAGRVPDAMAARLPWEVLETELQIKGDSSEADSALARLVVRVAAAVAGPSAGARRAAPGRR